MQAEINYGRHYAVDRAIDQLGRAVQDAVDAISPTVAAGVCGVRYPQIADAIAGREGRRLPVEWALAIALVAPEELRRKIGEALVAPLSYSLSQARPLTPAEELAKLRERVLHELGPLGAKLIAGVPL